jgi:uncharacterized protein involved in exopolysaccharide biosynthesis
MARKGINYEMVSNAAAAIKARGTEPTISAVRIELNNEGSFSTISQHLAKWREQDAERVDVKSLPEQVENAALTAITTIWNIATKEAREEIAAIKEDHNQRMKLLQADLAALLEANKHLEETVEREVKASEKDREKSADLEKKLTAANSELETTRRLYTDLVSTLKPQGAPARKAADTTQARPATPAPAPGNKQAATQEKH